MTTKKFPEASARDTRGYERSGADEDVRIELNKTELTSRLLAAACLAALLTLLSQPLLAAESLPSESPAAESLPELGADIGSTSGSGLSSGHRPEPAPEAHLRSRPAEQRARSASRRATA